MRFFLKALVVPACAALPLLFVACTPRQTIKPVTEIIPERPVHIVRGDTTVYEIAFSDGRERERFAGAFTQFLKEQQFLAQRYDSAGTYSFFKVLPEKRPGEIVAAPSLESHEIAGTAGNDSTPAAADTPPPSGGTLRLYSPRGSLDYPLSALVDAAPFDEKNGRDSLPGYFTNVTSSPSAITLHLAGRITNGTGRTLTVIDIINTWTRYGKEHPAEALALFRSCEGITAYLNGQEAIVLGFSAIDNATIRIKLASADTSALERLRTARMLPAAFKLGRYVVTARREGDAVLSPNRSRPQLPHVNELTVRCGGDANPLLSFSLGRYDGVLLWSASDLEYARRNLVKNGWCSLVGSDRYFVACAPQDSAARAFIASMISGADLLRNFVKAEGAPITAIESDSGAPRALPPAAMAAPAEPVTILFRKDDAVSKIVAERLLAAVTRVGAKGTLVAADEKAYESALAGRAFGCAVGWVPETVLIDKSEKLRLATMFFSDEADEAKRISGNREIPLFSVDWYLLAKERVGLYKGRFNALYVKQELK
jgi:hypothetical protein